MRLGTYLRLSQHLSFWRVRAWLQRFRFVSLSRIFRIKSVAQDERANTAIFLEFAWSTAWQLLTAAGLAFALQILELAFVNYWIAWWPIPTAGIYATWLGTIAQVGGVFIALYFTAVTAAAAAIYSQVPNNVRSLLARERWGNVYIRYLTFATFLPLCLIALHLLGFEPLRLAVPFVVVIAGIGIIAFTKLGQRAFNLFDPTRLCYVLFAELDKGTRAVSVGGFQWLDEPFQKHAYRQAAATIDTLETVSTISAAQPSPKGRAALNLTGELLKFLSAYQHQKLKIPTNSAWFEEKYRHQDWYLTDDTKVQLAHRTGTALSPETVRDHNWVEDDIERVVFQFFEVSVLAPRLDDHLELLNRIGGYVAALAAAENTQRAVRLIERLQTIFKRCRLDKGTAERSPRELMEDIAIGELLSFLHLQALTNYGARLQKRGPEATKASLRAIRWHEVGSIYTGFFRANELRQLEWLLPRIDLEMRVEGQTVTPVWYMQALISKVQAESLQDNVDALVRASDEVFRDWSNQLTKEGRVWQSAAVLSRHLEYLTKLESHYLQLFSDRFEALKSARYLRDLKWPDIKTTDWHEKVKESRHRLNESIAQHIVILQSLKRPEGIPDYFGQFVHATGESLFEDLLGQGVTEAKSLMPAYFMGSLALFEELKPSTHEFDVWFGQRIQVAKAPVVDLLELCGHSILLADLYGKQELWDNVRALWDAFISSKPEALKWFSAIVALEEPMMQLPHRGLIRTNWGMRVHAELAKLSRRRVVHGGYGISTSEMVDHPSALVRYAAKRSFLSGKDIFAVLYLAKLPGANDLEWGRMRSEMERGIEREQRAVQRA